MGAMKQFLLYGRKFALASNIFFGVLSFSMIIAGFAVRFGVQSVNEATLQKIKDSARDAFSIYNLSTDYFEPITQSLKQALGIFLIVTGILSAPLVVFGFYTFLRKKRNFLLAYVIITGCLVSAQIFVNFYFIKSPETVQEMMRPYLREKVNSYVGISSSDQVSLGWNYLMQEYQCCGVDSPADFKSSAYYAMSCPYSNEYTAVPGCCRILPTSISYSRCSNQKYCGGNSYDSNIWKDGCSSALFNFYYTRNTTVIWVMISLGLIDQIFLFVYAIILLRNAYWKVDPVTTSTATEVLTKDETQTTKHGLQSPVPSTPLSLQHQPVISSAAPIKHSFPPGYLPPASTTAAESPAQQPAISLIPQNHQNFNPMQVSPNSTISTAVPQSQPIMHLAVPTQPNLYPMQQFLPGATMSVHKPLDYAHNMTPSTYIPMMTLHGQSLQEQPQSQVPFMALADNGMQAPPQTQAPEAVQQQYYSPSTLQGNNLQTSPQTNGLLTAQQQN